MPQTNIGRWLEKEWLYRGVPRPANFYIALCTAAIIPSIRDTNTLGQLAEIAPGNGYQNGGFPLTPEVTDYDSHLENDTNDRSELQIKDIVWTASGGPIPASGNAAQFAVMTTNEATVANRYVLYFWDLVTPRSRLDGQVLTLKNLEIRTEEPAA